MKRNRILWLFAVVLILTMVSTSLVSGTLAKYAKEVTGSDTARVARFAFELSDDGDVVIADQDGPKAGVSFDVFSYSDDGGVVAGGEGTDGKKLVAPGTKGSIGLNLKNSSEVAVGASFALEDNDTTIPIYYTIDDAEGAQRYSDVLEDAGATYKVGEVDTDYLTLSALANALAVNLDPVGGATDSNDVTLYWEWAFVGDDTVDTDLGTAESLSEVTLDVTVTVTQLDSNP